MIESHHMSTENKTSRIPITAIRLAERGAFAASAVLLTTCGLLLAASFIPGYWGLAFVSLPFLAATFGTTALEVKLKKIVTARTTVTPQN